MICCALPIEWPGFSFLLPFHRLPRVSPANIVNHARTDIELKEYVLWFQKFQKISRCVKVIKRWNRWDVKLSQHRGERKARFDRWIEPRNKSRHSPHMIIENPFTSSQQNPWLTFYRFVVSSIARCYEMSTHVGTVIHVNIASRISIRPIEPSSSFIIDQCGTFPLGARRCTAAVVHGSVFCCSLSASPRSRVSVARVARFGGPLPSTPSLRHCRVARAVVDKLRGF